MKLFAVMCVEELADTARKIFIDQKVYIFSESEINGFHSLEKNDLDNWFASNQALESSYMFFTICEDGKAEELSNAVKKYKTENKDSHLYAFQLNVENFIH